MVAVQHQRVDELPAAGTKAQFTPTVWNGYLNMTGIDALASLRLKKS